MGIDLNEKATGFWVPWPGVEGFGLQVEVLSELSTCNLNKKATECGASVAGGDLG